MNYMSKTYLYHYLLGILTFHNIVGLKTIAVTVRVSAKAAEDLKTL